MKPFHIADPCHASWDAMRIDGASRFCASCEKRVFDLASMTERQIRGLTLVSGGTFCGRQVVRDGELQTAVEPPPPRRPGSAFRWPIRAAVVAGALGIAACGSSSEGAVGTMIAQPPYAETSNEPFVKTGSNESKPAEPTPPSGPTGPTSPELVEVPEQIMAGGIRHLPQLPQQVTFARGSAKLDDASRALLDAAAAFLGSQPDALTIAIEGHVSDEEVAADIAKVPKKLAHARAEAARKYLVSLGVKPERLHIYAVSSAPKLGLTGAETQRQAQRRVEMRICAESSCP